MILRWFAGIIFALLAFVALWLGGGAWSVFLIATLFMAGIEWANLARQPRFLVAVVLVLAFLFAAVEAYYIFPVLLLLPAMPVFSSQDPDRSTAITWTAAGVVWLVVPVALLQIMRGEQAGFELVFLLILTTVAQDTLALYGGMIFGREPTFCPGLSPKKTWAGFISGFLAVAAVFITAGFYGFLPLWVGLLAAVSLGVSGACGDLMFSALKRKASLDDTGRLLPGHGGLLDRVDALLINTAVFYTILSLAGIF
ncbi:MAG: phosphatidate cytidylyltransferase [bacterium]